MKNTHKSPILQGLAIALALTSLTWSARANIYATNIKVNGSTNSPTVFAGNNVSISYILSKQPRSKLRGIQKYDFTKPNKAEASFGVSNP